MLKDMYAIVQHSGFGYAGNPQFKRGLEERTISTQAQLNKVQKEGGKVFDNYIDASRYCDEEMYPKGTVGLVPDAPGAFSTKKIDGLRIYIPKGKS